MGRQREPGVEDGGCRNAESNQYFRKNIPTSQRIFFLPEPRVHRNQRWTFVGNVFCEWATCIHAGCRREPTPRTFSLQISILFSTQIVDFANGFILPRRIIPWTTVVHEAV